MAKSKQEIQDKIIEWKQALKDQQACVKNHQDKVKYCKIMLQFFKQEIEHIEWQEAQGKTY